MELGRTRMEVNVKVYIPRDLLKNIFHLILVMWQVKSVFGAKMFALGVVVKVPVPKQTAKTSFQVTSGKAKYNAALNCIIWKWVSFCLFLHLFSCLLFNYSRL